MPFIRWLPTFLAFPLGGLLAIETVGSLDGPLSAAGGGLLAGAVIGAAQWLALRSHGIDLRWVAFTAIAMAAGAALAAVANGAGTDLADVMLAGLLTGAAVGAAQSTLLVRGLRNRLAWTAVTAVGWSLGWLATWAVIVDIERGHHVFGASGAITATVLTGLALTRFPPSAVEGTPLPAVTPGA